MRVRGKNAMQSQWHIYVRSQSPRALFALPTCAILTPSFTLAGAIAAGCGSTNRATTKIESKCRGEASNEGSR